MQNCRWRWEGNCWFSWEDLKCKSIDLDLLVWLKLKGAIKKIPGLFPWLTNPGGRGMFYSAHGVWQISSINGTYRYRHGKISCGCGTGQVWISCIPWEQGWMQGGGDISKSCLLLWIWPCAVCLKQARHLRIANSPAPRAADLSEKEVKPVTIWLRRDFVSETALIASGPRALHWALFSNLLLVGTGSVWGLLQPHSYCLFDIVEVIFL